MNKADSNNVPCCIDSSDQDWSWETVDAAGWKIDKVDLLSVLGAWATLVQAIDTANWRDRIFAEFRNLEAGIWAIRQEIADLKVHISQQIQREFVMDNIGDMAATLTQFEDHLPGYIEDTEYAKRDVFFLLSQHEKNINKLLWYKDMSLLPQVVASFTAHHEMLRWSDTPLIVRKSLYQRYLQYFSNAVSPDFPGSWNTASGELGKEVDVLEKQLGDTVSRSIPSAIKVQHRGYIFLIVINLVRENRRLRIGRWDAYVEQYPPPPGGGRTYQKADRVGSSDTPHQLCWGAGGLSCSQFTGAIEQFRIGEVLSHNNNVIELENRLALAVSKKRSSDEGLRLAQQSCSVLEQLLQ